MHYAVEHFFLSLKSFVVSRGLRGGKRDDERATGQRECLVVRQVRSTSRFASLIVVLFTISYVRSHTHTHTRKDKDFLRKSATTITTSAVIF